MFDVDVISQLFVRGTTPQILARIFLYLDNEELFGCCPLVCKQWWSFLNCNFFIEQFIIKEFPIENARKFLGSSLKSAENFRTLLHKNEFFRGNTLIIGEENSDGQVVLLPLLQNTRFDSPMLFVKELLNNYSPDTFNQAGKFFYCVKSASDERFNHFWLINLEGLLPDVCRSVFDYLKVPISIVGDVVDDDNNNDVSMPIVLLDKNFQFLWQSSHNHCCNVESWSLIEDYPPGASYLVMLAAQEAQIRFEMPSHIVKYRHFMALCDAAAEKDGCTKIEHILRSSSNGRKLVNYSCGSSGDTALMEAARSGRLGAVSLLLDWGADVLGRSSGSGTALEQSGIGGHLDVMRILLERSPACYSPEVLNKSLSILINCRRTPEIVELLLEHGADVNYVIPESSGYRGGESSLLTLAIFWGNVPAVRTLIRHGGNVNFVGKSSQKLYKTPLFVCIKPESRVLERDVALYIMHLLIEAGADVNARVGQEQSSTLLIEAVKARNADAVSLLLENAADVDAVVETGGENAGWNALRFAEHLQDHEVINLLQVFQSQELD